MKYLITLVVLAGLLMSCHEEEQLQKPFLEMNQSEFLGHAQDNYKLFSHDQLFRIAGPDTCSEQYWKTELLAQVVTFVYSGQDYPVIYLFEKSEQLSIGSFKQYLSELGEEVTETSLPWLDGFIPACSNGCAAIYGSEPNGEISFQKWFGYLEWLNEQ